MAVVINLEGCRVFKSGLAVCNDCGHEWVAIASIQTSILACQKCRGIRGQFYCTEKHNPYEGP